MTLLVPPASFGAHETNLVNPANPYGTLVAAGTPAHTKNSTYTELIASTAFTAYMIQIMFSNVVGSGADTSMLVDLAIGGAGSESVIIPDLNAGFAANVAGGASVGGQKYIFPLKIPSGSRLSATAQSVIASDDVRVSVWLWGKPNRPMWAGQTVTAYGVNAAASKGVDVALGTSAAEGSFTEITSSTTRAHRFLALGIGAAADLGVAATAPGFIDVGVGAATESVIASNMPFSLGTGEDISFPFPMSVWADVAASQRIAVRGSWTAAGAQSIDAIVYGVS